MAHYSYICKFPINSIWKILSRKESTSTVCGDDNDPFDNEISKTVVLKFLSKILRKGPLENFSMRTVHCWTESKQHRKRIFKHIYVVGACNK